MRFSIFKRRGISFLSMVILISTLTIMPTFGVDVVSANAYFFKSDTKSKRIALTFDDGPHPRYTERILEILERYNVKATFFVIGINVERYPNIIEKVNAKGHEIANHSYTHKCNSELDALQAHEEISRCEKIIYDRTGVKPRCFRPPRGESNTQLEEMALKSGYALVLWSIDTLDWAHNPPRNITQTVEKAKSGDIILMHDYVSGKNTTCEALERIIPMLQNKGFEFVTVSELLALER